ncbi:MAG: prolyl oligopeptidase family serine peptidase [Parvularculaceae bacterium]
MTLRAVALASSCSLALACEAGADPMTPEDLLDLRYVVEAEMAPGGEAVAYRLASPPNVLKGEKNGPARSEVRIASGAGATKLFVPIETNARAIEWRNATSLAFLAASDDKTTLNAIDVTGGAAEEIFAFEESISGYAFAEGGNTLFFSAVEPEDENRKALKEKGFDANIVDEDARFTRLYRVDLAATDAEPQKFDLPGNVSFFAPSADGARIVVALADTPLIGDDIINRTFHIVNGRTERVENKIETEGKIGPAAFSPDGAKIAFLAGADRTDPIAHTLAVADAATGAFEFLTGDDKADEVDFVWTGNDALTVLAHRGVRSETFPLSADGAAGERQVHDAFVVGDIDGAPGAAGLAAIASAPTHPNALFVAREGGGLAKWTNHNADLATRDLGETQVVNWKARDGVDVEGVLVTPTGRKPRKGWPTIVVVHGGPEAHYANGWLTAYSNPGHIGAGEGYAVFYPNYRGSTGRGQAFAKLDHADPPAAEFNDVVDGVKHLSAEGLVDEARVGITGGSYGGYASAWGATALSEHFAAAVIFVALTDLVSFSGTTDIPEEMSVSHFQTYPEGNWRAYLEQSPVYHAAKSKTPALILHGEADPRVHPSQSLELYRYLKRVGGAPVRLVTYPGEGHGNRKAAGQYDYALRLMRWMDFYLKGDGDDLPPRALPAVEARAAGDKK